MFQIGDSHWLVPGEQAATIADVLLAGELMKWDNERKLPLKKGGFTDLYINIRDSRNKSWTIEELAMLYANPLRRLRVDAFVEVPDSVSPLAGHLSVITGIPIVTIREEEKLGRVVKGKAVGTLRPGMRVAIIDDVITDGASKLAALAYLRSIGVEVVAIVVLVNRQQGWKKKLAEAGFGDVPVWAGMTLHDVRKYLVSHGLMQRCDPAIEAKNPIIVALDGRSWEEILPLADQLRTSGCILKANDLLLRKGTEWLLPNLSVYGRVMIDPKGHDIKNTLENCAKVISECPPWAVTVHASGGPEMVQAMRLKLNELGARSTKILAVTVLTSLKDICAEIYGRQPLDQVMKLAEMVAADADGFVCSPQEVGPLKAKYADKTLVTPGVRSPGVSHDDQKRVDTPRNAMDNGATNLVMGRQILTAPDPVAEVHRVLREELGIQL